MRWTLVLPFLMLTACAHPKHSSSTHVPAPPNLERRFCTPEYEYPPDEVPQISTRCREIPDCSEYVELDNQERARCGGKT